MTEEELLCGLCFSFNAGHFTALKQKITSSECICPCKLDIFP